ncbi:MAG: hypothetical protein OER88_03040 [Planctomycetota bacterium]|nr:hypothetical protein [Planctomycetota bacterium]
MKLAVAVLVLAFAASAGGNDIPDPLGKEFKKNEWSSLPPWRQAMILERYREFESMPEKKRAAALKDKSLREYLLLPGRRFDRGRFLPEALREEVARFDEKARKGATRFALMRLRHHRRDRGLKVLPIQERWDLFRRLYPEPFSKREAHRAHRELKHAVVRDMAERVRKAKEKDKLDDAGARAYLKSLIQAEENRVVEQVRRELRRFLRRDPEQARAELEQDLFSDRLPFLTPRQSELVRYAYQPRGCPLLDLSYLGPRPKDRRQRWRWERDFHILARLELLSEAGFPREVVLHLADMGSQHDFLRAVKALRDPRDPAAKK